MKTNTTAQEMAAIIAALKSMYVHPFRAEHCSNSKADAQRNLHGKTHYVDDDTLRWHKSKVVSTAVLHAGLLYRITCSDALDMNNIRRGFRSVVFDLFGTTIERPKLEDAVSTSQKAIKLSDEQEIDLLAHYRQAIERELKQRQDAVAQLQTALAAIPQHA